MAKRKAKPAKARKPAKKTKAKVRTKKARPAKKPLKTDGQKKKKKKKRNNGAAENNAAKAGRAASRTGVATLPPRRPGTTNRHQEARGATTEPATVSDLGIAASDDLRLLTNADRGAGEPYPTQTSGHTPPTHVEEIAAVVAEREDQLEEIAPRLVDADEDELLQHALWWAGSARLPRAAIVGRALRDLRSFTEELASKRGTAAEICQRINDQNPAHLRDAIRRVIASSKASEDVGAALVGHLNRAWAVLEQLGLLRAAPRAGVYLIGRGPTVFDGFPEWTTPDEPLPEKPTRPPTRPRS